VAGHCPVTLTTPMRPQAVAVGGLVAMAAAVGVGRFVYTPILPVMNAALGLSNSTAGLIASANFLGYLAGALLAAAPALRGSRRTWLIAALGVSGLTTALMGLASSTMAFGLLRLLGGMASAFGLVFASALVLDHLAAAGRPALSAVHFAGVGTGIALSAILISFLLARGADWRMLWLASGGLALVAVIVVPRLVPDRTESARAVEGGARTAPRRTGLILAYGLFGFGYVITATFLVTIVRGSVEARPLESVVWIVVGVSAVPSVAGWTWVGRRLGNSLAWTLACLLEAAGVVVSVLSHSVPGILLAATLLGGTFMGLTALGLIQARQSTDGDPRRTLAVLTAAFGLGQIVGPTFAGVLHDMTGSFVVPSLTAAAALATAAWLVTAPRSTP
jgi:predicted MFS family arabinose efflux permease